MSLVVSKEASKNDMSLSTSWGRRDKKALRHSLPNSTQKPIIDYEKLRQLIDICGLRDQENDKSTEDAHRKFMENYSSIFVKPEPKKGFPIHSVNRSYSKMKESQITSSKSAGGETKPEEQHKPRREYPVDKLTHDIRDYLPLLHKQRKSEKPEAVKIDRIKTLRKILKKLPFQRTAVENDQIFNILKHFPTIAEQCSSDVLRELCVMAHLDVWKEKDVTIFGNTGWHMILKGKVQPVTYPYHLKRGQLEHFDIPCPTPEPDFDIEEVEVGECFGTLERVKDREPNSRILSVKTADVNCEFLKISCSDYVRVIEQIQQRVQTEKVNLLQDCKTFKLWSRQPLMKVANVLEWVNFPANTVLVSEGYNAPFVGIIKSGECHVLRQVDILHTLPNGEKEERSKQVVMGKLPVFESFGEVSCVTGEPMTCSIITATAVQIGVIEPEQLEELDETTRQLLVQSSDATYANFKQEEIHEEYVKQELKREWNEFKHNVVIDTINARGIRPGYGKWAK